MAVNIAIS